MHKKSGQPKLYLWKLVMHSAPTIVRKWLLLFKYKTDNIFIVNITPQLFEQGLNLYESRPDKKWGLVDCLSFIVMEQQKLIDAVTSDIHFIQAGFRALLR